MNSKKKTIKIIIGYMIFSVIISITNSCGGNPDYYRLTSISSQLLKITGLKTVGSAQIKSYSVERINNLEDTLQIRFDSVGIEINTEKLLAQSTIMQNNYLGIQSAYALEKKVEYEKIVDVIITSNKAYNSLYPAGANLKGIFMLSEQHYVTGASVDAFLQRYDAGVPIVLYKLLFAPDKEEVHTIKIKYITENNCEYETVVKNLLILK